MAGECRTDSFVLVAHSRRSRVPMERAQRRIAGAADGVAGTLPATPIGSGEMLAE